MSCYNYAYDIAPHWAKASGLQNISYTSIFRTNRNYKQKSILPIFLTFLMNAAKHCIITGGVHSGIRLDRFYFNVNNAHPYSPVNVMREAFDLNKCGTYMYCNHYPGKHVMRSFGTMEGYGAQAVSEY